MTLLDDLKTFVMAVALGVALTLSINYVVVNYTEGPAPVQAAQNDSYEQEAGEYEVPKPAQKPDAGGGSYGSYY
jgi:hypothetical protein